MLVQELKQKDFGRRTTFTEIMLQMFEEDPELVILTSDKAHFHLNGSVNKQNFRYWLTVNPRQVHKRPLHCDRVTVWAAVAKFGVIGPYSFLRDWPFSDSEFRPLCYHDPNFPYTQITQTSIESFPNLVPARRGNCPHFQGSYGRITEVVSSEAHLPQRWCAVAPPGSPDLSPCNFFLWGYLKGKVYVDKPRDIP